MLSAVELLTPPAGIDPEELLTVPLVAPVAPLDDPNVPAPPEDDSTPPV